MAKRTTTATDIDAYIEQFSPKVRGILKKIRQTIRRAAPDAEEVISYQMPAFRQEGMLIYFAAFKKHIGIFPPVRGDARLVKAAKPYAGPKGNLQFPLDEPMRYDLVARIVALRVKQNLAHAKDKKSKKK